MIRLLGVVFLFFAAASARSQGVQVKVYQNTDRYSSTYNNSFEETTREEDQLNFNRISVAVGLSAKHRVRHELELFIPELGTTIHEVKFPLRHEFYDRPIDEATVSTYSMRYEVSKEFDSSRKLYFSLGAGINPYLVATDYESQVSWAYDVHTKTWGFSTNVIPRVIFRFSERFMADLNVPLKIYDLRINDQRIMNPQIPKEHQASRETENIFFEQTYTIRLGFAYSIR
jgi:hypothetical protein